MTESETLETVEFGNTKQTPQVTQLKSWFFTWNNYPDSAKRDLETVFNKFCSNYYFQTEKGSNGTEHIQGVIICKSKTRWTQFKLPKEIHWEKTNNLERSIEYCQKSKTFDGKFRVSFPPIAQLKLITELRPWQQDIMNILMQEPDDRSVNWFWEEKGRIGKSAFTKFLVANHNALFTNGGKCKDLINLVFNQDMDKTKILIWDLPRDHSKISYSAIECVKNGMVCNTKFETGVKLFNPPHVVIFANFPPENPEKLSADRWNIVELKP